MHRICHFQCDISINSRTGIPSAGRDIIYRLYRNHIFRLAVAGKIFANIHRKRCISIMMLTHLCTIYIDRSIRIYTVEVQHNCFSVVCRRHRKGFAIPARAAGQKSAFCFTAGCKVLRNAVVMRQRNAIPTWIVEVFIRSRAIVSKIELPSLIEVSLSCIWCIGRNHYRFFFAIYGSICINCYRGQLCCCQHTHEYAGQHACCPSFCVHFFVPRSSQSKLILSAAAPPSGCDSPCSIQSVTSFPYRISRAIYSVSECCSSRLQVSAYCW